MKKNLLFVLMAVMVLIGCRQQEQQEEYAAKLETTKVAKQDVSLVQTYPAQIEGRQSVKIIPRIEGYLREIRIKEAVHNWNRHEQTFLILFCAAPRMAWWEACLIARATM